MNKERLKSEIIRMISEIEDESYLQALSVIIDTGNSSPVLQLTGDQIAEIENSKKDIEKGKFIENTLFEKEVKLWLKYR
jgi:hypothetical protein